MENNYGFGLTLPLALAEARQKTTEALAKEGFGIVMEIDMQKTILGKINQDVGPYTVLGACNPKLAHEAITAEANMGLLLPCNVLLRGVKGGTEVSFLDPAAMFSLVKNPQAAHLAEDVRNRLKRVAEALGK